MLRATRPTAVDLGWAVERALAAAADPQAAGRCSTSPASCTASSESADRRLAAYGAERFAARRPRAHPLQRRARSPRRASGRAGGVLHTAWERGLLAQVWVDETRPLLQGARLTAWELRRAGIPHRVVADSAAGSLLARGAVDRVVVGADRIAANGDVANKIGTYPLAVLADPPRGAVLRGRAALDGRSGHARAARQYRSRSAIRARSPQTARPSTRLSTSPPPSSSRPSSPRPACSKPRTRSRSGVSLRAEIVTVARELLRLGLVAGTSGNVSAREGELIHITPSAMAYADMTARRPRHAVRHGRGGGGPARALERAARAPRRLRGAAGRGRDRSHPQRARHRLELPRRAARDRHRGDRRIRRRSGANGALRADGLGRDRTARGGGVEWAAGRP